MRCMKLLLGYRLSTWPINHERLSSSFMHRRVFLECHLCAKRAVTATVNPSKVPYRIGFRQKLKCVTQACCSWVYFATPVMYAS